ncbi:MAG: polyprenyltransferase [Chitinophagaceae bacterium]|nr:MAG: polyprenyltransferase [Chitinophagaceae bacterium]
MDRRLQAYLRLTRPANLLTAISDIWAGAALSGYFLIKDYVAWPLVLLSLSSVLLYAGGVVMNDVFDAKIDAIERPGRPIPFNLVSRTSATVFGISLFVLGIITATFTSTISGILSLFIAMAAIIYDGWTKHHTVWGPFNMGLCRGVNLLLGMSILSLQQNPMLLIAIVPVIYIGAITLISRGEVQGGSRFTLWTALIFYIIVIAAIILVGVIKSRILPSVIFIILFILFIFPHLMLAIKDPTGRRIGKAVKSGVLGIILMNAAWVAVGFGWEWALITASLLPISMIISIYFEVT